MRNKAIKLIILISLFASIYIAALSIKKAEAGSGEPALIGILDNLGFSNIEETTQETFAPGKYVIALYGEFASYHEQNELSRYDTGTSDFIILFEGSEGYFGYISPPITKTFVTDCEFGLSFVSPEARYFTETDLNPDYPIKHAIVFKNLNDRNMFLIGFENLLGGGDKDYQDMVISLKLEPQPSVPEFGFETSIISSLAIVAYLAIRKRISRKKEN